ncbi:MAG: efflux RND transporter permease subunit [Pseudomonadota bacterium]
MIAWFVRNPVAANMLMLVILGMGVLSALQLRKETFPRLSPNSVTVSVAYDSGSAQQAEENITLRIEQALENVRGIRDIQSTSSRSGSTTTVRKLPDADLERLLNDVKAEVDAIFALPVRAERPVVRAQQWDETAIRVQLFGDVSHGILSELAERLRDDLLSQGNIARVDIEGRRTPEIAIEVDEAQLQAYGLSLADVSRAVASESVLEVSGVLRSPDSTLRLTADAPRYVAGDFARIPVRDNINGSQLTIGDVASVMDGYATSPHTWLRFNRQPSVGLRVAVDEQGDLLRVVEEARAVVARWQAEGQLPAGVAVDVWNDRSDYIVDRLSAIASNGLAGIVLVILLLSVTLQTRVAIWVAMGLPICFAGALLAMSDGILGMSINEVSTFGFIVAMGILVDDAIVVGESIYTHRSASPTDESTVRAVHRVAMPTLIGGLTTIVAFGSLAFHKAEFGQIFGQFALVVAACLFFSMIESKLILPAHLRSVMPERGDSRLARLRGWINERLDDFRERWFLPALERAIDRRYSMMILILAVAVGGAGLLVNEQVRSVFFPDVPGSTISVELAVADDASYGFTERALNRLERTAYAVGDALSQDLGAEVIESTSVRMTGDLAGRAYVALTPEALRRISLAQFTEHWRDAIGQLEGVTDLELKFSDTNIQGFWLEIKAADFEEALTVGRELLEPIRLMDGLDDVRTSFDVGAPEIRLVPTEQGRALGLSTQSLAQQLQQSFFGFETQRIQRGRDELRVRVRYPEEARRTVTDLWDMQVRTPSGQSVPLATVAQAVVERSNRERIRIDGRSAVWISANVNKGVTSPEAVVGEIRNKLLFDLQRRYPQVNFSFGGEAEELADFEASFKRITFVALIVIYAILAVALKSYAAPLAILSVIPFGIVGAVFGHWLHGLSFSMLSFFGVLALSGVVINDSLLLVSRFRDRLADLEPRAAVRAVAAERLRAILLTSLTTYVGLAPLIANPAPGASYLKPAAASLAYGVLFATFITLIFVPLLLMIGEDLRVTIARSKARLRAFSQPSPWP